MLQLLATLAFLGSDIAFVHAEGMQKLRTYRDESYGFQADFGDPTQSTFLEVDLVGTEVTVAGAACTECCNKARYDPAASRINKNTCGGKVVRDDGTSQALCKDLVGNDVFNLADYQFSEVVSATKHSVFVIDRWDGRFGLSQTLLTASSIGFYMKRTCSNDFADDAGAFYLGMSVSDTTDCGALGAGLPLTKQADGYLWTTTLSKVQVDIDTPVTDGSWSASFTTVSPYITMPKAAFDALLSKWTQKSEVEPSDDKQYWLIDCDLKGKLKTGGTLHFSFGTQVITMDMQQVVYAGATSNCYLRLRPRGASDPNPNLWEFGLPLFRTSCIQFDFSKNQMTFAPPKAPVVSYCGPYAKRTSQKSCDVGTTTSTSSTSTTPTKAPQADTSTKTASTIFGFSLLTFMLSALVVFR